MFFGQNRDQLRRFYLQAWRKHLEGQPIEPLEGMIIDVITLHPEYHTLLVDEERALSHDYSPEQNQTNPFLHMGMHIAIREQLSTRRPAGINDAYEALLKQLGGRHQAEHRMMECLGEAMWQAQRNNTVPDEVAYLACLQKLPRR
ncbi:MAG: DUF1841 family protein [Gammaproteobacteria bacterium]|nr:DUF1841 family protein [Gammaproteobacteria bacterium]